MVNTLIPTEEFVRLLAGSEHEIYRYIFALVPNADDARDIMQETAVALWRKVSDYDPGQPFVPWACRFAFYEVHNFRKHRQRAMLLSDEALEVLAVDSVARQDVVDARRKALSRCLEKLQEEDRNLLQRRYWDASSIKELAEETRRSVHTLYKTLERIRRSLFECVNRKVALEQTS